LELARKERENREDYAPDTLGVVTEAPSDFQMMGAPDDDEDDITGQL